MSFARRIAIGAALAIAIPLVFALLTSVNHRANVRRMRELLEPKQRALTLTTYLERLVIDMETGVRGFRQTGEERFLEPYEAAVSKYPSVVADLATLLDPARGRPLFAEATEGIETWRIQYAEQSIAFLRQHPPRRIGEGILMADNPPGLDPLAGKLRMDEIRHRFEVLASILREEIAAGQRAQDLADARLPSLIWGVAAAFSSLLLIGAFSLFRLYRHRAGSLFAGIETAQRGDYRPIPVSGDDELARIAAEFNRMTAEVKRRDEALIQGQARLEAILDNAPVAIYLKDPEKRYLFVNRRFEAAFGLSKQHVIGRTNEEALPGLANGYRATVLKQDDSGTMELEEVIPQRDGLRTYIASKFFVPETAGGKKELGSIMVDITERKRAEEEIERFFNLSLDMLCIAGFDGYFKRLNPAWEKALGFARAQLLEKPFIEFVHPEDRATTTAEAEKLSQGFETVSFTNRYASADGSYRWLLWNASPDRELQRIYAAARDITEKRLSEQEIEKLNSELQKRVEELGLLNQELEAFSYSVSHDLRAPLRHITGFSELLEKSASSSLDEKGHRYLATISEAAKQMGRLVDDLLGFSRMGRAELRREPVDLKTLADEVRQEVEREVSGREVLWKLDGLPRVRADRAMLRQVFVNLFSNALKYSGTSTRSEVQVGSYREGKEDVIFVRDNGVGFDMKYAEKLFGVFQRLHRAEEFEGTGIGLANVRRIIHRHGGRTWAEGTVGGGATFYFSLPRLEEVPG
jgi:PAS domain S-box-containing protein